MRDEPSTFSVGTLGGSAWTLGMTASFLDSVWSDGRSFVGWLDMGLSIDWFDGRESVN